MLRRRTGCGPAGGNLTIPGTRSLRSLQGPGCLVFPGVVLAVASGVRGHVLVRQFLGVVSRSDILHPIVYHGQYAPETMPSGSSSLVGRRRRRQRGGRSCRGGGTVVVDPCDSDFASTGIAADARPRPRARDPRRAAYYVEHLLSIVAGVLHALLGVCVRRIPGDVGRHQRTRLLRVHLDHRSAPRGIAVPDTAHVEDGGIRDDVPRLQHQLLLPGVSGTQADLYHLGLGATPVGSRGVLYVDVFHLDTGLRRSSLWPLQTPGVRLRIFPEKSGILAWRAR